MAKCKNIFSVSELKREHLKLNSKKELREHIGFGEEGHFKRASVNSKSDGLSFARDALEVLEGTPDVQLDWNEEMQVNAKDGIVSAMKILSDWIKINVGLNVCHR